MVLAAHNGLGFDFPLLYDEMCRCHMSPHRQLPEAGVVRLLDTLTWAKVNLPRHLLLMDADGTPSLRLSNLYESLMAHPMTKAHDASGDCAALLTVLQHPTFAACPWPSAHGDGGIALQNIRAWLGQYKPRWEAQQQVLRQQLRTKLAQSGVQHSVLSALKKRPRESPPPPPPPPPLPTAAKEEAP